MRFLVDEDLSPGLVEQIRALGHHADHVRLLGHGGQPDNAQFLLAADYDALITADMHKDAKTHPVAFQAACYRMRIIRLVRPKSGKFPAAAQGGMLAAQLDAIAAEIANPDGARMMNVQRGGRLALLNRDDVLARLREWNLEPWPEAGEIG